MIKEIKCESKSPIKIKSQISSIGQNFVILCLNDILTSQDIKYLFIRLLDYGLGAESQILLHLRKKNLVTIFSQGHVMGPYKPMFY